jgi:hypothetical protein
MRSGIVPSGNGLDLRNHSKLMQWGQRLSCGRGHSQQRRLSDEGDNNSLREASERQ